LGTPKSPPPRGGARPLPIRRLAGKTIPSAVVVASAFIWSQVLLQVERMQPAIRLGQTEPLGISCRPTEAMRRPPTACLGVIAPVTESSHAVFLSYASQDAEAAKRIATALRAAGIEVWFDKSELRGGDAWDRQIRERIHDCRLFVAVISAHTEARDGGYFRREWKVAVDRTHDMDERKACLVPAVIDATSEGGAHMPEKGPELQWTRLPAGETTAAFVERVRRLLSPERPPRRLKPDVRSLFARIIHTADGASVTRPG
jgi:TIR domain